jgi:hypothetical protein
MASRRYPPPPSYGAPAPAYAPAPGYPTQPSYAPARDILRNRAMRRPRDILRNRAMRRARLAAQRHDQVIYFADPDHIEYVLACEWVAVGGRCDPAGA